MLETITLSQELSNTINNLVKTLNLATDRDQCGYICDQLISNFPKSWQLNRVSQNFDNFSDIVDHQAILFHVFLITHLSQLAKKCQNP